MNVFTKIAAAAIVLLAFMPPTPAAQSSAGCDPVGDVRFVCGQSGPEDLAPVPRTPWIVASAMTGQGGLYAVDTRDGSSVRVYPSERAKERFDRRVYDTCPGPPSANDRTTFVTHGLYLKPGRASVHTLYAVHHGARESVEVFQLDAGATPPAVTWIGCAVAPDPIGLNAVAALPDGGFAATNFEPRPSGATTSAQLTAALLAGERNGEVWEWHTRSGWTRVPGSEAAGANGLEVSSDGKWLYVAQWGNRSFVRLSRGRPGAARNEIPLGFRVDNVRWAPDGRTLLVAGQGGGNGRGASPQTSVVGRIDPETMTYQELLTHPSTDGVPVATVAVQVGDELWVGSFRGDRIARYRLPGAK